MRRFPIILFLMVVFGAGAARSAETVVKAIEVKNLGAGPMDESFVLTHVSAQVGAPLDRAGISRDVRALLATGRFADVHVDAEPVEGGVRLVYGLRNRWKLAAPVEMTGGDHFSERRLRDLLELEPGDLVDEQVLHVRALRVEEAYRKDYYRDARVEWKPVEVVNPAEGTVKVKGHVTEGQQARVRVVNFIGNRAVPTSALRSALKKPPWWNPYWWIRKRQFDDWEFEVDRMQVRDVYLNRGYLDVAVDPPTRSWDKHGNLNVTFNVREGRPYRFGDWTLGGVTQFPEGDVRKVATIKRGDVASADVLRKTTHAIDQYYGSRGYLDTVVTPGLKPDPEKGTVDIAMSVKEGKLTTIRNIVIRGNTRTRDKVVRRELLVYPGEIYNEVKIDTSEKRVNNLGYFSSVRTYPESTRLPEEKDMVMEVEEKRTGQFMVGAGFSSVDQLIGFTELSQGNFDLKGWPYFTGGGQKMKLYLQFGTKRSEYDLSFVEPWFLDRQISLGVDLYLRDVEYDDYDVKRTGAAVTLGKALPGPNRINLRYSIERVEVTAGDTNAYVYVDDPTSPDLYFYTEDNQDTVESELRATLVHDSRNNAFIPSRGTRSSLFAYASGGPLGFDVDTCGMGFNTASYVPVVFQHVFSVKTRYETVDFYGDSEEVPLADRLFLGGGRTVRGFEYRDVGPKVRRKDMSDPDVKPYGGQTLAMASAEYTIPVVSILRFAGFYDIGSVWVDPYETQLNDLASSCGIGLRLDIPGFPIRVDYAWPLQKDSPYTERDSWVFWIGYDY